MKYIQLRGEYGLETVDEFETMKEAREMLKEDQQLDVVSIEEPEPEFKDGDAVEVGYETSDVWNPYTYALKFNGQHYVYGIRDNLIIAQKVRKPAPKFKYRWLMQNPETLAIRLSSFYETGAEAEAANGAVKALYPIEESKTPI